MSKHTPGPWIANGFLVVAPNSPHRMYGGLEVTHTGIVGPNKPGEQAEADARLIAAAPELLEALAPFAALLDDPDNFRDSECECFIQVSDIQRAHAAIAKATPMTPLTAQDLRRAGWQPYFSKWRTPGVYFSLRASGEAWHVLCPNDAVVGTVKTIDDLRNLLTSLHIEGGMP